jgi:hypothetical protein
MFLYELESNPMLVKLAAVTSQLKQDIDSGKKEPTLTVDQLLNYYQNNDIIVDKSDLYDLIKAPPLTKFIANIKGDEVIFKGQEKAPEVEPDESKKIVAKMAKQAMK